MRKRSCSHFFDTFMWWLIYLLPFLMYLFGFIFGRNPIASLDTFFSTTGLASTNSIIFTTLVDIFGSDGIVPLFDNVVVFQFFSWFIGTMLIHLAVDFLLFIPRLSHKWLGSLTQTED